MRYTSIMVSGLPGSGKSTLTQRLSESLGWPVHSIGQLFRDKWKERYPQGDISFEEFWRGVSHEENALVNEEMIALAEKGNIIGDTRYAEYCRGLPSLFLFVTAPLEIRAERALRSEKYKGKNKERIIAILQQREEDEVHTGQKLRAYDYRDPQGYHLVLNSSKLTIDEEVELVKGIIDGK